MVNSIIRYKVLLSAPSDCKQYCNIVKKLIRVLNHSVGDANGVELYPIDWESDSHSENGQYPQQVLNDQLVKQCDIIFAFFYKRFGTPTNKYDSGTEEEIELGLKLHKSVHLYFWKPSRRGLVSKQQQQQFQKIQKYKAQKQKTIYYKEYSSKTKFTNLMQNEITEIINKLARNAIQRQYSIAVRCINEHSSISKTPTLILLQHNFRNIHFDKYKASLISLCQQVEKYSKSCVQHGDNNRIMSTFDISQQIASSFSRSMSKALSPYNEITPVKVPDSAKSLVTKTLHDFDIPIPTNLFDFRRLSEESNNYIPTSPFTKEYPKQLIGSDEDKKKYELVQQIIDQCSFIQSIRRYIDESTNQVDLQIAIGNTGNQPLNHVKLQIMVPSSAFVRPEQLPIPPQGLLSSDDGTAAAYTQYAIQPSSQYQPYEESLSIIEQSQRRAQQTTPVWATNYDNEYRSALDSLFSMYRIINNDDNQLVDININFTRVQQGYYYSLPTIIPMLKDQIAVHFVVKYSITADELPEPIRGELKWDAGENK